MSPLFLLSKSKIRINTITDLSGIRKLYCSLACVNFPGLIPVLFQSLNHDMPLWTYLWPCSTVRGVSEGSQDPLTPPSKLHSVLQTFSRVWTSFFSSGSAKQSCIAGFVWYVCLHGNPWGWVEHIPPVGYTAIKPYTMFNLQSWHRPNTIKVINDWLNTPARQTHRHQSIVRGRELQIIAKAHLKIICGTHNICP